MKPDSLLFALATICLVLTLSAAAFAQGEHSVPISSKVLQQTGQSMPPEPDTDVTILRDDYAGKYNAPTLEHLSKMYWRLGTFDMQDTQAVANYLKINECKLYAEYVNDDLEWKEILATMRKHIEATRDTYPLNFQFVLQLHLGRYDPARGGFPIVDNTGFINAKRIEVASVYTGKSDCVGENTVNDYPSNIIVLLPNSFTLDFVKLDEHVAQAFILRKKSEYSALPPKQQLSRYERDAYVRLRVTFSQYHGNVPDRGGKPMAILYGTIDGYEVFEDADQRRLMLSVNNQQRKTANAPEMSVPVTSVVDVPEVAEKPSIEAQVPIDPSTIEVTPAPGYASSPSP